MGQSAQVMPVLYRFAHVPTRARAIARVQRKGLTKIIIVNEV